MFSPVFAGSKRNLYLAAIAVAAVGCGGVGGNGKLKPKLLGMSAKPPANVAVYFAVEDEHGQPVPDLRPTDFKIYEDGKLLTEKKGKRALLDPVGVESQFTMVIVDMSGPVVDSEDLPELVNSVAHFAERLGRVQQVAVSIFDGSEELFPVLTFGAKNARQSLADMKQFRPTDRNSNLNGAILQALGQLDKQLESAPGHHKFANLVIYTDRGDLAHKVRPAELEAALDETKAEIYVIGAGDSVRKDELSPIARTDAFYSGMARDLTKGFAEIGKKIEDRSASRYILSFCSSKKKGDHDVDIVVETEGDSGKLHKKFIAEGFKKMGCNPKRKPEFDEPAPKEKEKTD